MLHQGIGENRNLFANRSNTGQLHGDSNSQKSEAQLANATFVILARNWEVDGVVRSIQNIEDRFNAGRYPYVLLNNEPFSDDFKRYFDIIC